MTLVMQSEWQHRLDYLLVFAVVIIAGILTWRVLGPHIFAITTFIVNRILDGIDAVQALLHR